MTAIPKENAMSQNRATKRPVTTPVFHHTTFLTTRLDAMVEWYGLVAGLTPTYYGEEAAWLTCPGFPGLFLCVDYAARRAAK